VRGRRVLWLTLVAALVPALVLGSSGFSAAAVDRGVSVSVAAHDEAYVSVWDPGAGGAAEPPRYAGEDPLTPNETRAKVLVVRNRFDAPLSVTVTDRDGSVGVSGTNARIAPGAVEPVEATVECRGAVGRADVPLGIHAETDGVEGSIRFTAAVVCAGPPDGAGNESAA
jgi:hypothetical protein